jgi:hypothetical protein
MKRYFLLGALMGANLVLFLMLVSAPAQAPKGMPAWTGVTPAIAQVGRDQFAALAGSLEAGDQVIYILDARTNRLLVYSLEPNRVTLEGFRNLRNDFQKP